MCFSTISEVENFRNLKKKVKYSRFRKITVPQKWIVIKFNNYDILQLSLVALLSLKLPKPPPVLVCIIFMVTYLSDSTKDKGWKKCQLDTDSFFTTEVIIMACTL